MFMITYQGLSKLEKWDHRDPEQVLRALVISKLYSQASISKILSEVIIPKSLQGLPDFGRPTIQEHEIYIKILSEVINYIDEIKAKRLRLGITKPPLKIDNPPVRFSLDREEVIISKVLDYVLLRRIRAVVRSFEVKYQFTEVINERVTPEVYNYL